MIFKQYMFKTVKIGGKFHTKYRYQGGFVYKTASYYVGNAPPVREHH